MDQSDSGSAGIFTRWTNQIQEPRVYSHALVAECDAPRTATKCHTFPNPPNSLRSTAMSKNASSSPVATAFKG
eukprot:3132601-Pyramimonas_sp.AAC.1